MPVLLLGDAMSQWLGREPLAPDLYARLVRPLAPELMERRELGAFLNNPRNNGPECHSALPPEEPQLDLF
jgi:putative SOS response-associated peptidase YedK